MVNSLPAVWEIWVRFLGWEDPLEKGKSTHSSILAWEIPWTEEPGGLQSMDCKELDMKSGALVVVHEIFVCHVGSFVAACRLYLWVPECSGSVVAPHRLSCSMTCGILVLQPGFKPTILALGGRFLITGPPGKSLDLF